MVTMVDIGGLGHPIEDQKKKEKRYTKLEIIQFLWIIWAYIEVFPSLSKFFEDIF